MPRYPYLLPALIGLVAVTALYLALAPALAAHGTVAEVFLR